MKNVFILGLTDFQAGELETVRGAENYTFHSLLDYDRLVGAQEIDFHGLLEAARQQLKEFDGSVDAIVSHWDFPTSVIGPILAKEYGIAAPTLESVLKCEHKYWSRLEQQASIPEVVPQFASFDPFDDDALQQIDIQFPFWVKPVKAHSSNLGFEIRSEEEFNDAIGQIRAEIEQVGDAFNEVLKMVDLPPELQNAGGNTCLAEQFVSGTQAAPEGTMFRGKYNAHGVFDMHKDAAGTSFERLDYPANSVPETVQQRMIELAERYLRHVGFDNGCFNAEFMWDQAEDRLWLIEVNTRISQSH
ncbi:MAG TPA: ATP-grasp domain-containing protein, partial [Arthrobacter sp.]|nr:ATP-grasp domain-containing protein [Arthrobacter sp.]